MQQLAIGFGARFRCGGERGVFRVWREKALLAKTAMTGAARPGEGGWIIRHTRADGIEVDVAEAAQHVAFAVDQAGLVAAFPQCSGALVTGIELADVAASELLHEARHRADLWRRDQQVHMVVHQDVGVQPRLIV